MRCVCEAGRGWVEGERGGRTHGGVGRNRDCVQGERKRDPAPFFLSVVPDTQALPPPTPPHHPATIPQLCGTMGPTLPHFDLYTTIGEEKLGEAEG